MNAAETFETVHRFAAPERFYTLLTDERGYFLCLDDAGEPTFSVDCDDNAIWTDENGVYRHAQSGARLNAKRLPPVRPRRGPARLPSEYLADMKEHGWVCLTSILGDDVVEGLERVACTDRHAGKSPDRRTPPICQHPAVALAAVEPVSLWLLRQYMRTREVRLGHPPSIALLEQDDGQRDVQGWHSDFPYLWGFEGQTPYGRIPAGSGGAVLGVQRNVCISPFTQVRGATAFKLGSCALDRGPPEEWGLGAAYARPGYRAAHGLPYCGPEADVVEAPAGSIILYDSRTWHRAGVNRTPEPRAAMLQAMIPMYMMPFFDCAGPFKALRAQPFFAAFDPRERDEVTALMVSHMRAGRHDIAIAADAELSELLGEPSQVRAARAKRGAKHYSAK